MNGPAPIPATRARAAARGFTTIELMIVVVIIGILTALAMPAMRDTVQRSRVTAYANDVVANALRARSEAIKRNSIVTMCPSADGTACDGSDWSAGYLLVCASADGTTCDPTNAGSETLVLHTQAGIRAGWRLTESGGNTEIAFQPSGGGATTAVLVVCQFEPDAGRQERTITIGPTGRPTVARSTNGVCPGGAVVEETTPAV